MKRVKIAAISYINSCPFVYGIHHAGDPLRVDLLLDTPSGCVVKLKEGAADIAIVPVATLPELQDQTDIVSSYCISSNRDVRTVVLLSDTPLDRITRIFLDEDSRTSAMLVRILAREKWHIAPQWVNYRYDSSVPMEEGDACMLIGDKVFVHEDRFRYRYDLSQAWHELTGLPFVFAVWVARKGTPAEALHQLDEALGYGAAHIEEAIREQVTAIPFEKARAYFRENIELNLNEDKRSAIKLFLRKIAEARGAEPSSDMRQM